MAMHLIMGGSGDDEFDTIHVGPAGVDRERVAVGEDQLQPPPDVFQADAASFPEGSAV